MYLSRLRMSEIRGFHGRRAIDLPFVRPDGTFAGWTVIAGRNGSGKTSLLRAIALTLAGDRVAENLAPDYPNWRSSEESEGIIEASFRMDDEESAALFPEPSAPPAEPEEHGQVRIVLPVPTRNDWPRSIPLMVPGWFQSLIAPQANASTDSAPRVPLLLTRNTFGAGYGPYRRLSRTIADRRNPTETQEHASRFATLFDEDASLAEGVAWMVGLHLRRLEGDNAAAHVLDTVEELLGDGLLPDGYIVEKVNSSGLWVRRGQQSFPLAEMSDGYRTVTALVLDLVRHLFSHHGELRVAREDGRVALRTPGIVLIDEIDAHLHVSWQQRIGDWLKQHFPRVQFIVTTHSPYICQAADPAGLIRLPGPDEDAPAEVVEDALYRRVVYGTGDDAVLSDLFGLDSPYRGVRRGRLVGCDRTRSGTPRPRGTTAPRPPGDTWCDPFERVDVRTSRDRSPPQRLG
ncbi:AAA family ATPase [Streptomyces marincola]|uniref:AAA family ATPase n=1 Tax=Streptomyces marincola TaxID=2878388 RepID=UPI001CF10AFF|nr:ATP-binding protein [Streptomyces marincola]UCM88551.1 ATP-binding protein [Streptomyces marincola]